MILKTNINFYYFSEQLIILLANFNDVIAISSSIQFIQNDFQRIKYSFVLISQAFIGLVLIQENSIKTYYSKFVLLGLINNRYKMYNYLLFVVFKMC